MKKPCSCTVVKGAQSSADQGPKRGRAWGLGLCCVRWGCGRSSELTLNIFRATSGKKNSTKTAARIVCATVVF